MRFITTISTANNGTIVDREDRVNAAVTGDVRAFASPSHRLCALGHSLYLAGIKPYGLPAAQGRMCGGEHQQRCLRPGTSGCRRWMRLSRSCESVT